MNPYVSFGLAMCLVVGIALFFTAYLAVVFNRRAKADLLATLTPLSLILEGEVDLEEARAKGRYRGHIAEGRVANAPDGPGKVFYTTVIDGAGGQPWQFTIRRPKDPAAQIETKFDCASVEAAERITPLIDELVRPLLDSPGWLRIEYDPAPGHVRLSRPMITRKDIPRAELFLRQLDLLVEIAAKNRETQQSPAT